MSQIKKVISGFTFGENNKSLQKIQKRIKRERELKVGYRKMASLNLSLARMCIEADNEALSVCEEKLTECE